MDRRPSGEQYRITCGDHQATIVEVGGGVREYSQAGRPILDPYDAASMCDGAHGTPLIPWPNRLAGGRYRFDGSDYQVALTEPARGNAIHGFPRWRPFPRCPRATSTMTSRDASRSRSTNRRTGTLTAASCC